MCGIVALATVERCRPAESILRQMRDSMTHRGPDDAGIFVGEGIGLGHRRLSIIDLATGHQPMTDAEQRIWVVFNGEIYNYREIRADLKKRGYDFRTASDTEVILASYFLDGDKFLENLNGIFAIALWDSQHSRLILARDRMGIKPLYIWQSDEFLAAASEIKALLKHPAVKTEPEVDRFPEYLAFRHLADSATLFRGISSLEPGTMLTWEQGKSQRQTYWRLPHCADAQRRSESDYLEELTFLLKDSCQMQMVSDVPLGTFNSGGVDSSIVTSLVAESTANTLNTFCVGLEDSDLDESPFAKIVAERFGTNHTSLVVDKASFADSLPSVIWHHDEPLNHPNTVPMFLLSEVAKKYVTVVLTGEGSDELFAGYPRYRLGQAFDRLGETGVSALGVVAGPLQRVVKEMKWRRVLAAARIGQIGALIEAARYVEDQRIRDVLTGDLEQSNSRRHSSVSITGSLVSSMLEYDQRTYLVSLLNRLDRASMAFGIEARVPLLDHRIVEFAAKVPVDLKLRKGTTKHLVKRIATTRLPNAVVYRRKSGLALPLNRWFKDRKALGRYLDLLMEPRSLQRTHLRPQAVAAAISDHRSNKRDHSQLLWGLVNLELWQRVMFEDN